MQPRRLYNQFHLMLMGVLLSFTGWAQSSLSFQQALQQAYRNNPKLQAQIQKAEAFKGKVMQSGLYPNPFLQLEGENIGGSGSFKGFESAETTLSLTQPVPLGGQWQAVYQTSALQYAAMRTAIESQKALLYIRTGHAYIDVLYAERWYQVMQKLLDLNKKIVADIERRKNSGASSELDLRQAQIALGEVEIERTQAKRQVLNFRAALARVLGSQSFMPHTRLYDQGLPHQVPEWKTLKSKLSHSVFLLEKQQQLKAKRMEITAVKKQVWPIVNFKLGARHFSDDNENALVISANGAVPVFNRNQGNIYKTEAEYTQIMNELLAKRLEIRQQLYQNYLEARQKSEASVMIKNKLLPLARKATTLAQQGYQRGLYPYVALSNALTTLFKEERHYQQAHAERDKALISLNGLLGPYSPGHDG